MKILKKRVLETEKIKNLTKNKKMMIYKTKILINSPHRKKDFNTWKAIQKITLDKKKYTLIKFNKTT